jgi:uncharacterized membrane protein HdeD (DUF308 family)
MPYEEEAKFSRLSATSLIIGFVSVALLLPSSGYDSFHAQFTFFIIFACFTGLALISTIAAIISVVYSKGRRKGIWLAILGLIVTIISGLISLFMVFEGF